LAVPSQPQSGDPPPPTTPPVRWTVLEIVRWTTTRFSQRGLASPRLDAEILAAHALGMSRVQLYVQYDRPLDAAELAGMRELVKRRQAGESVAYIIGKKEFFGIERAPTPRRWSTRRLRGSRPRVSSAMFKRHSRTLCARCASPTWAPGRARSRSRSPRPAYAGRRRRGPRSR
jgi:hypothetical protein